ncbi:hypothetical protein [Streptomyces sp. S3(2020)]|uniref:hypothetical protein n=1 Tax=Streptomyces sp. S3(2020) TaxID=2732044 RepID=UPI0019D277A8
MLVLALDEMPDPRAGRPALVKAPTLTTHRRTLTRDHTLTLARYEPALEPRGA